MIDDFFIVSVWFLACMNARVIQVEKKLFILRSIETDVLELARII
jgi:hypothetical protein